MRYLELKNYRKFRSSAVEFPDGVIGIIGPNGVGKSTLIEAVSWALYGNDAQRTSKEEVLWAGADRGEECSVLLEFDLDGDQYRVKREMKGKDLKMRVTMEINNQLQAEGDRAVTQAISEKLGMDYKAFFISVFARQKDLDALSILPPGERRQLILRMLDVDALDRVIGSVRNDRSGIESQLKAFSEMLHDQNGRDRIVLLETEIREIESDFREVEGRMESKEGELGKLVEGIEEARRSRDELSSLEREHHRIQKELAGKGSHLSSMQERLESLGAELSALEGLRAKRDELKKLSERLDELDQERERMDALKEAHQERVSLERRLKVLKETIAPIEESIESAIEDISKLGDLDDRIATVSSTMAKVEDSISEIGGRIVHLETEIRGKERDLVQTKRRREEIDRLGPDSSCPTCERKLGDQHDFLLGKMLTEIQETDSILSGLSREKSALQEDLERDMTRRRHLTERLETHRANRIQLAGLEASLELNRSRLEETRRSIEEIEGRMDDLGGIDFHEKSYKELKREISGLREPANRFREICGKMERMPEVVRNMGGVEVEVQTISGEVEALTRSLESLSFSEGGLIDAQRRYEQMIDSRDSMNRELSELQAERRVLTERLRSIERECEELRAKSSVKKRCEEKVIALSALVKLLGDFKSNLISRIVPTLSEVSSSLFNEMTDSKYGGMEVDKDYNVMIYDGGEKFRLERFSGGEGDLANLCLRLAISRVIAERSGSSVDFLILDEIFGSQDQSRKRNIMATLNRLSNKFKQIVLITHIDDVKDFMGNVIYVNELEDGSSELVLGT